MRTFAARQRDLDERRYDDDAPDADPTTSEGARQILSSRGGKKAARIALAELWQTAKQWREGYLPTARISAPLRVLLALERAGLIEVAEDDRGMALRYRLTSTGVQMAAKAQTGNS